MIRKHLKFFTPAKTVLPVFALVVLLASAATAATPRPPATPRDYVTDLAGVMKPEVARKLNGMLRELEQKTSSQVLVLTVETLDGQGIEEFGFETKEKWKLGQKGKDNGVLIVIAVKDRKYRFEIGYGLESILPDSLVGSIGRQYLVPYFRQGDYGTGIYAATLAIANTIAADAGCEISGMPRLRPANRTGVRTGKFNNIFLGIVILIGAVLVPHPSQAVFPDPADDQHGRQGRRLVRRRGRVRRRRRRVRRRGRRLRRRRRRFRELVVFVPSTLKGRGRRVRGESKKHNFRAEVLGRREKQKPRSLKYSCMPPRLRREIAFD